VHEEKIKKIMLFHGVELFSGQRLEGEQAGNRGMNGLALGLLVIRLGLGSMLAVHGLNKVFGSGGLAGTARWFEGLGLRPGWLHARLAAGNEIGAGLLMACGLWFPLAGAAFIGLMTVAAVTDHRGKGFFVFKGGWEYVALIAVISAALVSTGPGRYSADAAFGWQVAGPGWAGLATVAGLSAAGGLYRVAIRRPASGANVVADREVPD
jgi:putative oxidoreductase